MIRTVVILLQVVFTERYIKRLGIEELGGNFEVRILDLTPWLKPDVWKQLGKNRHEMEGYKAIFTREEALHEITKVTDGVAFDYMELGLPQEELRDALVEHGILRATAAMGLMPIAHTPSTSRRLRNALSMKLPQRVRAKITGLRHRKPKPPDIAVITGQTGLTPPLSAVPHKVDAHGPDYDEFMSLGQEHLSVEPYALYLDEDVIFHPDYEYAKLAAPASEEKFYPALEAFFDDFEARSGLKVLIAAHPRSTYGERPHLLRGRDCRRAETARLVRDSAIVFAHSSTAFSFVALWRKPVVCLTSNEIERSWFAPAIHQRAEFFDAPLINIDKVGQTSFDLKEWSKVNLAACAKYIDLYVKVPGSPERPLWNIVADYLKAKL